MTTPPTPPPAAQPGQPPVLPSSIRPLLVRTAFDDVPGWAALLDGVATPSDDDDGLLGDGFLAAVEIVDLPAYRDLPPERLRTLLPAGQYVTFFFVADAPAVSGPDHPLLAVPVPQPSSPFLDEPPREAFRVAVSVLWSVENNLSLGNMDWVDFAGSRGPDGVYRGF